MGQIVQLGEIVPSMVDEFVLGLDACINKNKHRREPYFILYTADWYQNGEQLKTTFTPFGVCPPKMLNTMCWKVNNKNGRIQEVWVLPKDAPIQHVETDGAVESIAEDAVSMPLIYG